MKDMKQNKSSRMRIQGTYAAYILCMACAAFGWWGALYPQFSLLQGTYEIVCEDSTVQAEENVIQSESGRDGLYWEILNADRSRIRIKSRLLEDWNALKEGKGRDS